MGAQRRGIWECHDDQSVPTVRTIDDLLVGGQNSTVGTTHSHRPTDVDSLVAQARAVAAASPSEEIHGCTDDFRKAFKQVLADPLQLGNIILVQFCPDTGSPAFFVPFCQAFGSKSAPVNFSRFLALYCSWQQALC